MSEVVNGGSTLDNEPLGKTKIEDEVIEFVWNPTNINSSGDFREFARQTYLWEHNPSLVLYFSEGVCLQVIQNDGSKMLFIPNRTIRYIVDTDTFDGGIS